MLLAAISQRGRPRPVNRAGTGSAGSGAEVIGTMEKSPFLTDIAELRRRAREHIDKGAVTEGYRANRETVIELLNAALATEIVCVLRYKRHYFMAQGPSSKGIAQEFLEHAVEEQTHADQLAERITQLGGAPNLSPEGMLSRSHSEYVEGKTLLDMVKEDLVAERIAVESYSEVIRYLGDKDPTTRRLLEEILAKEEEHAEDLTNLLAQMGPQPPAGPRTADLS
jgi:bacterioferritin